MEQRRRSQGGNASIALRDLACWREFGDRGRERCGFHFLDLLAFFRTDGDESFWNTEHAPEAIEAYFLLGIPAEITALSATQAKPGASMIKARASTGETEKPENEGFCDADAPIFHGSIVSGMQMQRLGRFLTEVCEGIAKNREAWAPRG